VPISQPNQFSMCSLLSALFSVLLFSFVKIVAHDVNEHIRRKKIKNMEKNTLEAQKRRASGGDSKRVPEEFAVCRGAQNLCE
jgi:hypothetical protein